MEVPANADLQIYQGATNVLSLEVLDIAGHPKDITGAEATFVIRHSTRDPFELLRLDEHSGIIIDGPNGQLSVTITAEDSGIMQFTEGVYDVYITVGGKTKYLAYGKITLVPRIAVYAPPPT